MERLALAANLGVYRSITAKILDNTTSNPKMSWGGPSDPWYGHDDASTLLLKDYFGGNILYRPGSYIFYIQLRNGALISSRGDLMDISHGTSDMKPIEREPWLLQAQATGLRLKERFELLRDRFYRKIFEMLVEKCVELATKHVEGQPLLPSNDQPRTE